MLGLGGGGVIKKWDKYCQTPPLSARLHRGDRICVAVYPHPWFGER